MITTETVTAQELGALHQAAELAAGLGVFRYRVEVTGRLQPGPSGPLKSDLAGVECVWHRHVVTRSYLTTRPGSDGRSERAVRTEVVSQRASSVPFQVRDATVW